MLDIQQILQLVPHRYPFLLLDRVLEWKAGINLIGLKNVTINEPFFPGHFPGQAVMPGVLILESLAQAALVLAYSSTPAEAGRPLYFLAGIDNARFKRPVTPGDQLRLEIDVIGSKRQVWKFKARALVENQLACECELLAAPARHWFFIIFELIIS